ARSPASVGTQSAPLPALASPRRARAFLGSRQMALSSASPASQRPDVGHRPEKACPGSYRHSPTEDRPPAPRRREIAPVLPAPTASAIRPALEAVAPARGEPSMSA